MPIVGGRTGPLFTTTYSGRSQGARTWDARRYSHTTATYISYPGQGKDTPAPPLTTIFTPLPECANRWMLGEDQTWSRTGEHFYPADDIHFDVQSTTIWNINFEAEISLEYPLFTSCLPYGLSVVYSPGVCPHESTVAEVTAWTESRSSTTRTYWQASCCRSGMGFGPEFPDVCISTISTPMNVHAFLRTTYSSGSFVNSFYTSTVYWTITSGTKLIVSSSLTSNIVTVTTGLALEEPIVVAWQNEDVPAFPTEYASSLAKRLGVTFPSNTDTSSQQTGPAITGTVSGAPNTEIATQQTESTPNTGAKVGIGVGVTLAALALIGAILLFLRHRRRKRIAESSQDFVKAELDGGEQDIPRKRWHAHVAGLPEADQDHERQELDSKALHAEADGSTERRELAQLLERMGSASPVELDANNSQRSSGQDGLVPRI
ncbi:hypothetical protein E8E13_005197 [Curvularia kusanoi]|uniref:Uncharacterized protein n=1 Tax=Curvularia kusanoi TaxID=90978 RepID=A0A9P4W388_CURKU|nr:hypothetical protein E8E13_005197 [Curvularia kusanoi]